MVGNENSTVQPCSYCGVPANTIDHVPPRKIREYVLASGLAKRYPFCEVPACRECNSLLGAMTLWHVPARKKYIKNKLAQRYAKYLRIPDWSAAEIANLRPGMMRSFIEQGLRVRDVARQRIAW